MRSNITRWCATAAVVTAVHAGAATAEAVLSAYEGFNYPVGSILSGQSGGSGFSGAWSENDFGTQWDSERDLIRVGSLPHNSLERSGASAQTLGAYANVSRPLASTTSVGTVYLSFLMRYDAVGSDPGSLGADYGGMAIGNLFIGKDSGPNNYALGEAGVGNAMASTVPVTMGQSALLVTRVNLVAGPDAARLYVNPTPGGTEPATPSAVMTNFEIGTIDLVNILAGSDAKWSFDEIRVGSTYASVTPTIYSLPGDSNLDKKVDFSDLVVLAQNYGKTTGQTWTTGDFSGDGGVSFPDLVLLAQNYGRGVTLTEVQADLLGNAVAADWTRAQALVPEPLTAPFLGAAAVAFGRRRQRSRH